MRAVILVVEEKEFNEKMAGLTSAYKSAYPDPDVLENNPKQFNDSVGVKNVMDSAATAKK